MNAHARAGRVVLGHLTIRELGIADASACTAFGRQVDEGDVRRRFASGRLSLPHLVPALVGAGESDVAFGALDVVGTVFGVLNLAGVSAEAAEIALIVRSDVQRRGIGRALLTHAVDWARHRGISHVFGLVLAENDAMLALAVTTGFRRTRWDGLFVEVSPVPLSAAVRRRWRARPEPRGRSRD